jgi:hypothetical protein
MEKGIGGIRLQERPAYGRAAETATLAEDAGGPIS